MIETSLTLYKLIVLYMLNNVSSALTNSQISDCILEEGYTSYFHLQQALSEMEESRLIISDKVRNTTYYEATEEGIRTLGFFENEISPEIRAEVDEFLKQNSYEIRSKAAITADYYETADGEYAVICRVKEKKTTIFEMTLTVPVRETAEAMCKNWEKSCQKIYAMAVRELS